MAMKNLNEKDSGRTTSGYTTHGQGTRRRPIFYLAGNEYSYVKGVDLI